MSYHIYIYALNPCFMHRLKNCLYNSETLATQGFRDFLLLFSIYIYVLMTVTYPVYSTNLMFFVANSVARRMIYWSGYSLALALYRRSISGSDSGLLSFQPDSSLFYLVSIAATAHCRHGFSRLNQSYIHLPNYI